jgi:uncharacterized membrane protein YcaP (DUF421 family)
VSELFHVDLRTALTAVATTIGIYLAFVVSVRITGPRALTSTSSFDLACVVALGAVLGRTALLTDPTLPVGVIALVTFLAMQALLGSARQSSRLYGWLNPAPVILIQDGELLRRNMRAAHVVEDELRQAARRAGARGLGEIRCAVLERNGAVSVVRAVEPLDPWLLDDIPGSGSSPPRP